jgi:tetratricopeptide (TPR) repeat protein
MDGTHGLQGAPNELLGRAKERTHGNPRALEALFAALAADRDVVLEDYVSHEADHLPDNVVAAFIGDAFQKLDRAAQFVLQILAVFGRPVDRAAVEFVIRRLETAADARLVLSRLVGMQLVRKDKRGYYLHSADQEYALSQLRDESEKAAELTLCAADYYAAVRPEKSTWGSIEDLAVPMAEFELRMSVNDFDRAAAVLDVIGFHYLQLWGHNTLVLDMYERIRGKVVEPRLKEGSLGNLGTAYWRVGRYGDAIEAYEDALEMTRSRGDEAGEAAVVGNLGTCYSELGYIRRATALHRDAVEIQRRIGDTLGLCTQIGNLGSCLRDVGDFKEAQDCFESALELARKLDHKALEAGWLGSLGLVYGTLGDIDSALPYLEQARAAADEAGARLIGLEASACRADLLLDTGDFGAAAQGFEAVLSGADAIGNPRLQGLARLGLAMVRLCESDVNAAMQHAESACEFGEPMTSFQVLSWLGIMILRDGDLNGATERFSRAEAAADLVLHREPELYSALYAKGLNLSGLAVATIDNSLAESAVDAYERARDVTVAPGVVRRAVLLFDQLAQADSSKILKNVRAHLVGKSRK